MFRLRIVSFFEIDFLILIVSVVRFATQNCAHDHGMKSKHSSLVGSSQFFPFRSVVAAAGAQSNPSQNSFYRRGRQWCCGVT
ncbi:Uncharacterised protein [Vibrio cholerae]|nr:Uncharacterised protein [Vibrio cholerae]